MKRSWIGRLVAVALCAMPFVAAAQDSENTLATAPVHVNPPHVKAAIWTDKLGYSTGEQMEVYLTFDAMGDSRNYTHFLYRENIDTGMRQYLSLAAGAVLSDSLVDTSGATQSPFGFDVLPPTTKERIWQGSVPAPGLWHWVLEMRNQDATRVEKKIYAKFVVAQRTEQFGFDGANTEISTDTGWGNDAIYQIRHQVFVNAGATLRIQAGTLILARGQNAVIVVEKGGKIIAEGRRDAPIVMTCDGIVGQRTSGCWGGLIILGNAPMTRGTGLAEGVIPETRPTYGGNDPLDSSGVLRYVRVEFAGVDFNPETQPNAFGFHGVGHGTVIDHIQAHEGEDDGIEFFGGSADCMYCVSSGSKDDSLDWAFGWTGRAQYVFIQQDPQGDNGIEADNDSQGFDRTPRSHPHLYNVTLVGGLAQDANSTSGDGMRIRVGTAITARNVLLTGFGGDALDVRDNSPGLFTSGTSSIKNSIIYGNGGQTGDAQIRGSGVAAAVEYHDTPPYLVNVRYEANPDPRPQIGSPALFIGNPATPPGPDGGFDSSAQFIGAFGAENWLEEWTFFGDEFDYDTSAE